ncbi:MAG: hypothetical protein PVH07_03515 [Chloroflexota bacterium]|jgi:hypothetical protein
MTTAHLRHLLRELLPHLPVLVAAAATVILLTGGPLDDGQATLVLVLWLVALLWWPIWLVATYVIGPRRSPGRPRSAVGWAVTPIVLVATVLITDRGAL